MTLRVPCLLALASLLACGDKESTPGEGGDDGGDDTAEGDDTGVAPPTDCERLGLEARPFDPTGPDAL